MMFSPIYGMGRAKDRYARMGELAGIRADRPEFSPLGCITESFAKMNPHYIAQILDGARKVIRLGGGGI